MKITKLVHSCLLVEMPEPVNRTVLFDPGSMSHDSILNHHFDYLDDIVITHSHGDHMNVESIAVLKDKFPDVRILGPADVVEQLNAQAIDASTVPSEGIVLFNSPHADVEPLFPMPQQIGVHYLDTLTNPGDSHEVTEAHKILALPVQAPWGSLRDAVRLGLRLKPDYIIPIHDWHWSEDARTALYAQMEKIFSANGITFIKTINDEPIVLDV